MNYLSFLPKNWQNNPWLVTVENNFPVWNYQNEGYEYLSCDLPLCQNGDPVYLGFRYDSDFGPVLVVGVWLNYWGYFDVTVKVINHVIDDDQDPYYGHTSLTKEVDTFRVWFLKSIIF